VALSGIRAGGQPARDGADATHHGFAGDTGDKEKNIMKKQIAVLFALALTSPLTTAVFAQETAAKSKETRFEGRVQRSSKEQSSLTIRQVGGSAEKTCVYDSSTKWVSQYHGDKKVNDIDASQVKDGDYVICKGSADGSIIHASLVSKRLTHGNANQ
jgi:hypothetical protein